MEIGTGGLVVMSNIKQVTYPKVSRMEPGDPICLFNRAVITHKVDGTNGRIIWDSDEQELLTGSRNRLLTGDKDNHGFDEWVQNNIPVKPFKEYFEDTSIVVFGEFFKNDILGRVEYGDEPRFRAFDVFINTVFLDWADVVDVAEEKLSLDVVPYEFIENPELSKLQDYVDGYTDPLAKGTADDDDRIAEGIVARPPVEVKHKKDSRIMYKVKSDKFEEVNKGTNKSGKSKEQKYDDEDIETVDKYITNSRIRSVVESMREQDPTLDVSRQITGEVIQETIQDIKDEATEELDDQVLGKYGGGQIAQKFHTMINKGVFMS
jgi:hypothetical protein